MVKPEAEQVRQRYARRSAAADASRYSFLHPFTWLAVQERQRAMLQILNKAGYRDLGGLRMLEVGCGTGGNLLEFLRFGVSPSSLRGIELLEDRVAEASRRLPPGIVESGDALTADVPGLSQDVVLQSLVFSSLLDRDYQQELAARMWSWVRPGGGVLWYDFVYDNPSNPDVAGVPLRQVKKLFPGGSFSVRRVTLAPPVGRRLAAVHPALYTVFNSLVFLRTHLLCWIGKPHGVRPSKARKGVDQP